MKRIHTVIGLGLFFYTLTLGGPVCQDLTCTRPHSECYCDDLCLLMGDCCIDWIESSAQNNNSVFKMKDATDSLFLHAYKPFLQCAAIAKKNYMIIFKCSEDFDDMEIRQNCEELSQSDIRNVAVSLTTIHNNGLPIVFRNMYCAICHGFSLNITMPWTGNLACEAEINADSTTEDIQRKCSLVHQSFPSDVMKPRECMPQEFRTCPIEAKSSIIEQCNNFLDPIFVTNMSTGENEIYKNKYCLICNDVSTNRSLNCGYLNNTYDSERVHGVFDVDYAYSLSFKDDRFVVSSQTSENIHIVPFCTDMKVFDVSNGKCVMETFPEEYTEDDCTPLLSPIIYKPSTGNGSSDIMVVSLDKVISKCPDGHTLRNSSLTRMENHGKRLSGFTGIDEKSLLRSLLKCHDGVTRSKHKTITFQNFIDKSTLQCNNGILVSENVNKTLFTQRSEDIIEYRLHIFNTSLALLNFRFNFVLEENITTIRTIWYCIMPTMTYPNCSTFQAYDINEFSIVNGTAKHTKSEVSYLNGTYILERRKVFVCAHTNTRVIDLKKAMDKDFFSFLYATCFCVSFISFLVIIFIHLYFRKFRNLHGKCIISLSSAHILTEAIILMGYFIPQKFSRVCAILLHFSFYAIFAWVIVLGFNFARRLNSKSLEKSPQENKSYLFLRYSVFAWTVPFIVIIPLVVFDALHSWTFIGYGEGEEVCRLGSFKVTMYAFVLPGTVFLILNIIFLIVVISGIESSKRHSKALGNSVRHTGRCAIYTKLSVFMGITWIILASSEAFGTGADALHGLNIIVNGSQCFLILLAILCNRKLVQKLRRSRKHHR